MKEERYQRPRMVIASDQRERGNLTVVDPEKDGEIASLRSQ